MLALLICIWDEDHTLKLGETGAKLIYSVSLEARSTMEAVPLSWEQPCFEICLPSRTCQPVMTALSRPFLPIGYWGLMRAAATSPLSPTNNASIFPSALPVPSMQFAKDLLLVNEKEGVLQVPIIRSGDLSYESSVRCYTQGHSAQVMEDFEERRNADSSRITFLKGEKVSAFMMVERSDSLFLWCLYLSIMNSFRQILNILGILLLIGTIRNTIICPVWLSSLYPTYNQTHISLVELRI